MEKAKKYTYLPTINTQCVNEKIQNTTTLEHCVFKTFPNNRLQKCVSLIFSY